MVRGGAHKKVTIFWQQAILILANEKKRERKCLQLLILARFRCC